MLYFTTLLFILHLAFAQDVDYNLDDTTSTALDTTTGYYNDELNDVDSDNYTTTTVDTSSTGNYDLGLDQGLDPNNQRNTSADDPLGLDFITNGNEGSNQCPDGWASRTDKDGKVYGYKVIMQDMINYFQARNLCLKEGGELVSIHSDEEEQFVANLASPSLDQCQTNNSVCRQRVPIPSLDSMYRSLFIGLNRAAIEPYYDPTVVQTWADGTTVDYASVPNTAIPSSQLFPWGSGSPSGGNDTNQKGFPENCVCMYKGYDDKKINWNDIACYHKLGGAICKRQCGGGGGGQVCPCTVQTCGTAGWTKGKEGSGNAGREYKVFNIPSPGNYWQALAVCASNGAKVASYHSEDQKNAITHICQSSNCAWIGLHTSPSGTKYWDDGSQYNYQNLLEQSLCQRNPTSPNCGGGNPPPSANCPKDCTAVSSAGQTTDQSCESSCGSVICEKECVIKS